MAQLVKASFSHHGDHKFDPHVQHMHAATLLHVYYKNYYIRLITGFYIFYLCYFVILAHTMRKHLSNAYPSLKFSSLVNLTPLFIHFHSLNG
jgi:hypothetical protein